MAENMYMSVRERDIVECEQECEREERKENKSGADWIYIT